MRALMAVTLVSLTQVGAALADDSEKEEAARVEVDRLLASQSREFAGCFEKSLKQRHLISDVTLFFQVEPRGKAGKIQVKVPGYAPRSLSQCITRCVQKLSFPLEASFMSVEHRIQIVDSARNKPQRH